MKKLLIIIFASIFAVGGVWAQKVKIEKKTGIMSIDKTDVARFQSTKNADKQEVYTFTDLNSDDYVVLTMVKLDDDEENFLEVSSNLSDKTSEMDYELVNFTLSMNSGISNLIVKKYAFFTTEGMNKDAIIEFLSRESNRYKEAYAEKVAQKKAYAEKIAVFSPVFKNNADVINKNTNELLARFEKRDGGLAIKDHQENPFAVLVLSNEKENGKTIEAYHVKTFMKETFVLDAKSENDAKRKAVEVLIVNNYFGDGENSYALRKEEYEAQKKLEEEQYKIRTNVNGILTLEDGKVVDGRFMTEFRESEDGRVSQKGTIISLDGKTLNHYYKDNKGKDKVKIYKEKEMQSFKIIKEDDPDFEEYYCKIEYLHTPEMSNTIAEGGGLDVLALGKNLFGNKPKKKKAFAYRAADMQKTALYYSGNSIIVENKNNNERVELTKSIFADQLKEIASGCTSVINNIENGGYELNRESIYNFVQDYEKCE